MPTSFNDWARWASAAEGAYALFGSRPSDREALLESGRGDFVSSEVARYLGEISDPHGPSRQGFELRNHQPNDLTGFSATVFFDRTSNKYVLSIRGTEQLLVDVAEDLLRIGGQGFAGDQLVSLYRYYKRLTTPAGQPVHYSDSEVLTLQFIRLGVPVNGLSTILNPLRGAALRDELAADVGIPPTLSGAASVIPAGAPLIVTGHSLGGHLALLFGRFFPEVTEHVYTYNAPGIGPHGELALRAMGIPPIAPSLVTNVASELGNEAISKIWSKPGEVVGIATEPGTPLHQHSIVPLTDTLALYGAFGTLSPGSSLDASAVSGIIQAASPLLDDGIEVLVGELGTLLGAEIEATPIARTGADRAERDKYFENLYRVLDRREPGRDYQIVSLAGKSAAELEEMAHSEIGVRYALSNLQPFAAKNANYSTFEDSFSGQWLASRAEWLEAQLSGNIADTPFAVSATGESVLFRDLHEGRTYAKFTASQIGQFPQRSGESDGAWLDRIFAEASYDETVVFGLSDIPNQFSGRLGDDWLFGGKVVDALVGDAGDDYLEGGGGDDRLLGDAGDDTLVGGEGADRLEGGAGDDAYVYAEILDGDTISDTDGRILVDGSPLLGGRGASGGAYQSEDGRYSYAFSGDLDLGGTLTINGTLRVENFRNGNLGIRLRDIDEPEDAPPPAPPGGTLLVGDAIYRPVSDPANGIYIGPDEYGNPTPGMYAGSMPDQVDTFEVFPGTPGATHFISGGGDDVMQDILGGDDWLELGTGDDFGWGGTGDDLVEGGPGRDIIAGGRGDDVLYAGMRATKLADLDDDGVALLPGGGDLLSGGDGNDFIFGDAEANLIEGGAGEDRIYAGAGDDWIGADVSVLPAAEHYRTFSPIDVWTIGEFDFLLLNPYLYLPTFSLGPSPGFPEPRQASINGQQIHAFLLTEGSRDYVDAGAGNDAIYAGAGEDVVFGGAGDDYVVLTTGADTVSGGAGRDTIIKWIPTPPSGDNVGGDGGDDGVGSGGGSDGPSPEGETVPSESGGEVVGGALGDTAGDNVEGGDGENFVVVGGGGGNESDTDTGVASVTGDASGDFIASGSGGETGDDIDGGDGDDYIDDMGSGGNRIDGGAGNDRIHSGAGADLLLGGPGDDRVSSFGGDDALFGGDGNDQMHHGGGGHAFLAGGAGDDLLVGELQHYGGSVTFGWSPGDGNDRGLVLGGSGTLQIGGRPGQVSVEYVTGIPGGALANEDHPEAPSEGFRFALDGDSGCFLFLEIPDYFDRANFSVRFADGTTWDDAYLRALAAAPGAPAEPVELTGSGAEDIVYGGEGSDRFAGSVGNDWLLGGAGDDVYEYAVGDGFDQVEDSEGGSDMLRFAGGIGTGDVSVFASGPDYILAVGDGGIRIRGGRTAGGAVEGIEFEDGSHWTLADLEGRAEVLPDNRAPNMPSSFGRVAVDPGDLVAVTIPAETISDPDRFDAVGLYAITADGERLPAWLNFDATSRTLTGAPGENEAGVHDLLFIAADTNGAASVGSLTIAVGPDVPASPAPGPSAPPAVEPSEPLPAPQPSSAQFETGPDPVATPAPSTALASIPRSSDEPFLSEDTSFAIAEGPSALADSADPAFREVQHRLDVLLQTGRSNLGERYAEAIREFEERRSQREEAPLPPPPTDEEVEAWNSAMHSWHDRNPGYAETELGTGDGTWSMGWGLPAARESAIRDALAAASAPGLANPSALARLQGAASAPALSEGLRQIHS